jgi:hypothetical protein
MGEVESRVVLRRGLLALAWVLSGLGQFRNSPGARWNAALTGPFTIPAWKPAFASPNEMVEAMRM